MNWIEQLRRGVPLADIRWAFRRPDVNNTYCHMLLRWGQLRPSERQQLVEFAKDVPYVHKILTDAMEDTKT